MDGKYFVHGFRQKTYLFSGVVVSMSDEANAEERKLHLLLGVEETS
jgi:hypothetical protein